MGDPYSYADRVDSTIRWFWLPAALFFALGAGLAWHGQYGRAALEVCFAAFAFAMTPFMRRRAFNRILGTSALGAASVVFLAAIAIEAMQRSLSMTHAATLSGQAILFAAASFYWSRRPAPPPARVRTMEEKLSDPDLPRRLLTLGVACFGVGIELVLLGLDNAKESTAVLFYFLGPAAAIIGLALIFGSRRARRSMS